MIKEIEVIDSMFQTIEEKLEVIRIKINNTFPHHKWWGIQ